MSIFILMTNSLQKYEREEMSNMLSQFFIYLYDGPSVTGGSKTKRKEEEKNARKKNPVRYEDTWYMPAVYTIIRNY